MKNYIQVGIESNGEDFKLSLESFLLYSNLQSESDSFEYITSPIFSLYGGS
jgi:hypothetical protein